MKFINRENELKFLKEKWNSIEPQLIIIYGKRRVGKTELCIHFAEDKPHIYYLSERITPQKQLQKFTEMIALYFHDDFLPETGFRDWETAFRYIVSRNEKMVIIIDEFHNLAESDPGLPSSFQKIWDLYLAKSQVYLILSGSSIAMMEETTLFYKAPLYGRRTGQLLIKPFHCAEIRLMFPDKPFSEILAIYSMVGGIPLFLNKFYDKNYQDVLKENILKKGEPLYEEVEFILREELKEPRNYFVILEALSLGKHKLAEIINETGLDKGLVSRYLSILNSLQITLKKIPVTENIPEKSRKSIYIIDDHFIHFWFRYIFRNKYLLEEHRIDAVIEKIEADFSLLQSITYEKMAREILMHYMTSSMEFPQFERIGSWWDRQVEIDIIGINEKENRILFGEVKWTQKQVGTNILESLKEKSSQVVWGKPNRQVIYCLFSKTGFTPDLLKLVQKENIILFREDRIINLL